MITLLILLLILIDANLAFVTGNWWSKSPKIMQNGFGGRIGMQMSSFITHCEDLTVKTDHSMSIFDITSDVEDIVAKTGCKEGVVTVMSKHTTVSVTLNEMEGRLVDDIRQFFLKLAPSSDPYLHNDLDYRIGPEDWPGGDEAWREFRRTQPVNTHSHLIAMILGTTESIPITKGKLTRGKYQNIMVADIDGPKDRTIVVQVMGRS